MARAVFNTVGSKVKRLVFLLILIFQLEVSAYPPSEGLGVQSVGEECGLKWQRDINSALSQSREEKKPLLLFFTGSDWSGWSIKFKDEVLNSPEFGEKIDGNFICVELDTPLHAPPAPENEQFSIMEFPTLLLLTHDRREIARFGYLPLTGKQLADDLLFIVSQDAELNYLLSLLDRGERTESILRKAYDLAQELCFSEAIEHILDEGMQSKDPGFYLVEKYRRAISPDIKEKIQELNDPELLYHVALIDFQSTPTSIEPLEEYLEKYGLQCEEHRWQLEMMIAQYYFEKEEIDLALKHANAAKETAPSGKREEISHSVNYMHSVFERVPL